jgi:hypothetical protein
LLVEDSRGRAALKQRAETAVQFDRREREQRLAEDKPRTRLSRSVALPEHGIDELRLSMTRQQVQAALPGSRSVRVLPLSDGVNILFTNEPPPTAAFWPRQLFIRFGSDNRVAELRVRYQDGPHAATKENPCLFEMLRKKAKSAPASLPASWAGLWTDLRTTKPPVQYRWLDDTTSLTYQHDTGGSEVTLRECPADKPTGIELPPLAFCDRGVVGCSLGDALADVRKRWQISKPLLAGNGAEVLTLPANSPYDVLLVWYEGNKVSRLIARHREPRTVNFEQIGAALQQAWAQNFDRLGYVRRRNGARGQVLQSYGWHDDQTRVRIFAQDTEDGTRLFTEWREWPIPVQTVAAK